MLSSGPVSVQRALWNKDTFTRETYEFGAFRGQAQKVIDSLLDKYHATRDEDSTKGTRLSLLEQMDLAAQYWISNHTITTTEGETEEDTARKHRMAGMKKFIDNVGAERAEVASKGPPVDIDQIAKTKEFQKLQAKYSGNASRVFTAVATLIDAAVPNRGDSVLLDIDVEIPVSSAGFIGGHLKSQVSRTDDDLVKARTELTVTGGAKAPIAKFKAEAGGYIEAAAATGADVMNLYSYGLYRRFRESKVIPSGMTSYMWGGRASSYGKKKSEEWSRSIEKAVFQQAFDKYPDPDPSAAKYDGMTQEQKEKALAEDTEAAIKNRSKFYVETGGMLSATAQLTLIGKSGISAMGVVTSGRKITADSIKKAKGGLGAKNVGVGGLTGAQKQLGESTSSAKAVFDAAVSAGPVAGLIRATYDQDKQWTIMLSGEGHVPMNELTSNGLGTAVTAFAMTGIKLTRAAIGYRQKQKSKEQGLGLAVDTGEDLTFAFTQLAKSPSSVFKPDFDMTKGATSSSGLSGSAKIGVKLAGSIVRKWNVSTQKYETQSGTIEASLLKTKTVSAGLLTGKLQQSSRIVRLDYDPSGGWSVS